MDGSNDLFSHTDMPCGVRIDI